MADGVKADKNSDDATLGKLVRWFEASEESSEDARTLSERDRDYYDNKQYTSEELATLADRKQPALTINKIKGKINFSTGHEKSQRVDPKAYPRNTPDDVDDAEAATDAIRFVVDNQDGPSKFSDVYENMLIEGYGGIEVNVKERKRGGFEITLTAWEWDRLFFDPHSSKRDFSDAKYLGGVIWMDAEDAALKYPGKEILIDQTVASAGKASQTEDDGTFDDKPRHNVWAQLGERKRIRIVNIYWKEGEVWKWAIYTLGGILEGNEPVIFIDDEGDNECPLIMQSAYVDRDNDRYGDTRALIGLQDEKNKRRSKLLHQLSVRQVKATKSAVDNVETARRELARPDGWIEVVPGGDFEVLDQSQQLVGQFQLLQSIDQDFDEAGANASLQGNQEGTPSGRAIQANQIGGIMTSATVMDRFRHLKLRVYRQIWNRIRQFWTEERWIRVTDNEDSVKFVGFNREMTAAEAMIEIAEKEGASQEELAALQQQIAANPDQASQVVKTNQPAKMDMDIIIEEAPDTITIQQEQFEQLANMASAGVPIPPDVLIQASSLRNKDELIERMKGGGELSPDQQKEAAQVADLEKRAITAEVTGKEADVQKTEAETIKTEAEAAKTLVEVDQARNGAVQ